MVSGDNLSDTISIDDQFLTTPIRVDGGDSTDFLRMEAAGGPASLYGGNGDDFFDFSFLGQNLGNIAGFTNVYGGGGADSIFAYDNANSTAATYTVGTLLVSRSGFGGFSYEQVDGITLITGVGGDTVNVPGTAVGAPLFINSSGGQDTVNVGGIDGLASIGADVQVQNLSLDLDTLNINDTGDITARNATIDNTNNGFGDLFGMAPSASIFWNLNNINRLNLTSGNLADTINLIRIGGVAITCDSAGGNDAVKVGNGTYGMTGINNNLKFLNSNGFSDITLDDSGSNTPRTITHAPVSVGGFSYERITGITPAPVNIDCRASQTNSLTINTASLGGNIINLVSGSTVLNVIGHAALGPHDTVNIGNAGSLSNIAGTINISNPPGFDDINITDTANANPQTFAVSTFFPTPGDGWGKVAFTNFIFPAQINFHYADTSSLTLAGGVSTTNNISGTGTPTTIHSQSGTTTFNITPTDGAGHATIHGALSMYSLAGTGSTSATFDSTGDPTGVAYTLAGGIVTIPGSANIDTTGIGTQTFNGGSGNDSWMTALGTFSNPPTTINAGGGNDTVNLEVRLTPVTWQLDGGTGTDTMNLTDGTNTSSTNSWVVNSNVITRHRDTTPQDRTFNYSNWETANLTGSQGADTFTVNSLSSTTATNIHAAEGSDIINVATASNLLPAMFAGLSVDGGPGGAALTFDNSGSSNVSVSTITASTFTAGQGTATYSNLFNLTYNLASFVNTLAISDTSAATTYNITGAGGNDTVNIGSGSTSGVVSTINFNPGAGADAVNINDQNDAAGHSYTFVAGLIAVTSQFVLTYGSVLESIVVNAGNGADTMAVNAQSLGTGLTVNAGGGDDSITVGNAANHLSNLNGPITVSGNGGSDALIVNASSNYGYRVTNSFVADLIGSVPAHSVNYATMEGVTLYTAGTAVDCQVQTTAAGTDVTLWPGAADSVTVGGSGFPLTGILSAVYENATLGGGNALTVDGSAATNPAIVHVNAGQVGGVTGDTLFGPGGKVFYAGVSALTVNTPNASTGDTIYARPISDNSLSINAGQPTTAPGDSLILAFANAGNPVFTSNGIGAGKFTFSSFMPLMYTGMEQVNPDNTAPAANSATFNFQFTPQSLLVGFTESLANAPGVNDFLVQNQATLDYVPLAGASYSSTSGGATVTFNGLLPDGNYLPSFINGDNVTDFAGNQAISGTLPGFFMLTADANHDRFVNTIDFTALAQNFGKSNTNDPAGVSYGQGDFNYDGKVNALDFNILATKFGTHLAPASTAPPLTGPLAAANSPTSLFGTDPISLQDRDLADVI